MLNTTNLLLCLAVVMAAGCSDLPDIEAGECGNGVIDVEEDCDGVSDLGGLFAGALLAEFEQLGQQLVLAFVWAWVRARFNGHRRPVPCVALPGA